MLSCDRPVIFEPFKGLIAAQSTRLGGISPKPFESLNLGLSTGDERANVEANRKIFFDELGISETELASSGQVHGADILIADKPQHGQCYDAVMTIKKGLFVGVSVADCTPVLIYDCGTGAVAAIHAGWRGTVQQITLKTLDKMKLEFGTKAEDCYVYVGTCISEKAFEVGNDVAKEFNDSFKRFDDEKQKYFVDLKKANLQQLVNAGVAPHQIEVSTQCTVLNNDRYFSYRKEKGQTGRMLAVIGVKQN
ncbi:MAG: peptidoglycan editing factor PgeF [Bacteroidia bacterium]